MACSWAGDGNLGSTYLKQKKIYYYHCGMNNTQIGFAMHQISYDI